MSWTEYVIWSNEHNAFWAPGERGYVPTLRDAGRYDAAAVTRILKNTWCPGHAKCCNGGQFPHEVALLVAGTSAGLYPGADL